MTVELDRLFRFRLPDDVINRASASTWARRNSNFLVILLWHS